MQLDQKEIKLFKDFIKATAGIQIQNNDRLVKAVSIRAEKQGFFKPYNYFKYLKYHPLGSVELRNLLTLITINESSFFRNENQYEALRKMVLPCLFKNKKKESSRKRGVSVWSAGCSSGEEPYSIAIEILENPEYPKSCEVEILGTDVDKSMLKEAKKATYNKWRLRNVDKVRLQKYFNKEGKFFRLKPKVRDLCSFDYHNLIDEVYPQSFFGKWDIIFCKNVFIYFNIDTIRNVLDRFAQIIRDDGFLFLGHSESIYKVSDKFKPVKCGSTFIYKRDREKKEKPEEPRKRLKVRHVHTEKTEPVEENTEKIYRQSYEEYIKEHYIKAGKYIEKYLEKENDMKGNLLASKIFFEQNKMDRALDYAHKTIEKGYLNPLGYFVAGIINLNKENYPEAEKYLKKALYLKKNFALAHFRLAELYENKTNYNKAILEYRNAIMSFGELIDEEPVELAGGFTVKTMSELSESKMKRLQSLSN